MRRRRNNPGFGDLFVLGLAVIGGIMIYNQIVVKTCPSGTVKGLLGCVPPGSPEIGGLII